jgi:hypothetical protein
MKPKDYDEIPECKILFLVSGGGLVVQWSRWGRTADQKMVAVQVLVCPPDLYWYWWGELLYCIDRRTYIHRTLIKPYAVEMAELMLNEQAENKLEIM